MRTLLLSSTFLVLSGCCGCQDPPVFADLDPITLEGESGSLDLAPLVNGGGKEPSFVATSEDPLLITTLDGSVLELQAQPEASGTVLVDLEVSDGCGNTDTATLEVSFGGKATDMTRVGDDREFFRDPCAVFFRYAQQGDPDAVYLAGSFNAWSETSHPMQDVGGGVWTLSIPRSELSDGPLAYRFVEDEGGLVRSSCDPLARLIQCDDDYKPADSYTYTHECVLGLPSCNSMILLEPADTPRILVDELFTGPSLTIRATFAPGCAGDPAATWAASYDGNVFSDDRAGESTFYYSFHQGGQVGRHTFRLRATDTAGRQTEETYVPFWTEDRDGWRSGVLYFAFLDRMARGDVADVRENATANLADYEGGDLDGLIRSLDYLEDLGVTAIWVTNLQGNPSGTQEGDCGSYSSYHGYWPDSATDPEEHFGDDALIRELVAEAHARGIRVMMDWVANHVYESHPYYDQHPDWFQPYDPKMLCEVADNWNDYPETCWFDPFLPDVNYYNPEPLGQMVEDALWWVKEYELDGYRVDAAKHMPHSVVWNLNARLDQEVEYRFAWCSADFYTVGETFSGRDVVKAYVNENELDGQFDFDIYWGLRAAFLEGADFSRLEEEFGWSQETYGDALMGTFLGNHDVSRFISYGITGGASDGIWCEQAPMPGAEADWSFGRLELAWAYLLTHPGIPLVYYGDELGIPGYHDPDNRQPLWWYASAFDGTGDLDLEAVRESGFADYRAEDVLDVVSTLALQRQIHRAFTEGVQTEWWLEPSVYAYARVYGEDSILVILNGDASDRSFTNGLSFAGLPTSGVLEDILTGETFTYGGDTVTITVPANTARVMVMAP